MPEPDASAPPCAAALPRTRRAKSSDISTRRFADEAEPGSTTTQAGRIDRAIRLLEPLAWAWMPSRGCKLSVSGRSEAGG